MLRSSSPLSLRVRVLGGLCSLPLLAAAGCGGTDVSPAVNSFNKQVASSNVRLDCPKTVSGDTFDCKLVGTKTMKSAPVKLHLVGKDKDTIDFVDQKMATKATTTVLQP